MAENWGIVGHLRKRVTTVLLRLRACEKIGITERDFSFYDARFQFKATPLISLVPWLGFPLEYTMQTAYL